MSVQYETQKTSKSHNIKRGPNRVLKHVGAVYTVENLVVKVIREFRVKLISECKHDENNTNIDKVAKLDDEYSDIFDLLDHRYEPNFFETFKLSTFDNAGR